jgi:hypothetical protein
VRPGSPGSTISEPRMPRQRDQRAQEAQDAQAARPTCPGSEISATCCSLLIDQQINRITVNLLVCKLATEYLGRFLCLCIFVPLQL